MGVSGLTFQVNDLNRALEKAAIQMSDLNFKGIADEAMHYAAQFAPRRTGALRASLRASRGKSRATIKAGNVRVPYAGAINYGWSIDKWTGVHRNIVASEFMQRADAKMKAKVGLELRRQLDRIIAQRGLG